MIRKPKPSFETKRWKFKLKDLGLGPLRFSDEVGELYNEIDGGETKVYELETPNIIGSEEVEGRGRRFCLFKNYMELYRYSRCIRETTGLPSHLYEICPYFMKIHFDIDLGLDEHPMVSSLFEGDNRYHFILKPYLVATVKCFEKLFPSEYDPTKIVENLLAFETRRKEKISFHIVLDGYYMPCHECWLFYKEVMEYLSSEAEILTKACDSSVYKKNQSFRILGSNKVSGKKEAIKEIYSGPPLDILGKRFCRQTMIETSFDGEEYEERLLIPRILPRSLLSHTMGCIRVTIPPPRNLIQDPTRVKGGECGENLKNYIREMGSKISFSRPSFSDEEIVSIMNLFLGHPLSKSPSGTPAFKFSGSTASGLVCLRREHASFCGICERIHENENPYLTVSPTGDVHYYCRRNAGKQTMGRQYIGNIVHS